MEVNVGNRTSDQKTDYWNKIVSKFRSSNLSVNEFSKRNNISTHQLSYWKTKIVDPIHEKAATNYSFIEVKDKTASKEQISLSINDVITINFSNPPSPQWISELINSVNKVA